MYIGIFVLYPSAHADSAMQCLKIKKYQNRRYKAFTPLR